MSERGFTDLSVRAERFAETSTSVDFSVAVTVNKSCFPRDVFYVSRNENRVLKISYRGKVLGLRSRGVAEKEVEGTRKCARVCSRCS